MRRGCDRETTAKGRKRIRILLVDDHPLVRERLAEVINREADLMVCGEAEDHSGALDVVERLRPNLVIVDLSLKNSDGLDLIKDIHSRWPSVRMLVLSVHDESLYAERVLRAGAQGYICKQEATRKVMVAIRRVLAGDIYLSERSAAQRIRRLTAPATAAAASPIELLANRELQVFELTGQGLNIRKIATRLHIAPNTVETYRARIREKLKVKDGSELLQLAISWAQQH
jgi:DNA-binding NarL/FixJ family response regulator